MNNVTARAAFAAAGFSRLLQDFEAIARPAIRISTTAVDEATLERGASKLGGLPDLPPGVRWPEWHGLPQSFLAQLRFADLWPLAPADIAPTLPRRGLLWFFYDARQETYGADPADLGGWRVLALEGDPVGLQRTPAPATLPSESRFHACALRFAQELTFSQQPALEIPNLAWTNADQERYERLLATLQPPATRVLPQHRCFGFPETLQDDMRLQCQLTSRGITDIDDPRAHEVSLGAMDWRLLLQVDADAQAGMRWASAGMLYYWIRQADLQAQRFDAAWLVLQSD